jgi:hypothetical protein
MLAQWGLALVALRYWITISKRQLYIFVQGLSVEATKLINVFVGFS